MCLIIPKIVYIIKRLIIFKISIRYIYVILWIVLN